MEVPHLRACLIRFAAVILMMTTLPSLAASTESPDDFVRRVYARYRNDAWVPMDRPNGAAFYTASLLDTFEKDTAVPTGAGITAEWDPICNCHGILDMRIKSITIAETRADMVRAQVVFINMSFSSTVTLTLLRTPVGWRIADVGIKDASYRDVGDTNVESLIALLRKANEHLVQSTPRNAPPKP